MCGKEAGLSWSLSNVGVMVRNTSETGNWPDRSDDRPVDELVARCRSELSWLCPGLIKMPIREFSYMRRSGCFPSLVH